MKNIFRTLLDNAINYFFRSQKNISKQKNKDNILSGKLLGKKYHITYGASLTIDNKKTKEKEVTEKNIEAIAKKYLEHPEELFKYMENSGTSVYLNKNADKLLKIIDEEEGFILPKNGIKALYLNLITKNGINFSTPEMFILKSSNMNKSTLLYNFYNWYCYKKQTDGFEPETQDKFKKLYKSFNTKEDIEHLTFDEVLTLKTAARRDIDAMNFVKRYTEQYLETKDKLKDIKTDKMVKM